MYINIQNSYSGSHSQYTLSGLVSAFVFSRLNNCNSTLAGLPVCALKPLRHVLHAAVRLVAGLGPRDHVREGMKDLHWLPIAHRIQFKLCILMHGAIFGQSQSNIRELLIPVSEMQGRRRLRSTAAGLYMTFISPEHSSVVMLSRWLPLRSETVVQ